MTISRCYGGRIGYEADRFSTPEEERDWVERECIKRQQDAHCPLRCPYNLEEQEREVFAEGE